MHFQIFGTIFGLYVALVLAVPPPPPLEPGSAIAYRNDPSKWTGGPVKNFTVKTTLENGKQVYKFKIRISGVCLPRNTFGCKDPSAKVSLNQGTKGEILFKTGTLENCCQPEWAAEGTVTFRPWLKPAQTLDVHVMDGSDTLFWVKFDEMKIRKIVHMGEASSSPYRFEGKEGCKGQNPIIYVERIDIMGSLKQGKCLQKGKGFWESILYTNTNHKTLVNGKFNTAISNE